ncbi:MAG: arginyltransferase, partial [Moraxellaceae bacterium]|nr:arginyltransferase [Moraxellaceae bacterium]
FYDQNKLVAVSVTDELEDGLSAVYTFYDPDLDRRSLGTLAILSQIKLCQLRGLKHLYLGYWVKQSPRMSYKARFRPLELLINGEWLFAR